MHRTHVLTLAAGLFLLGFAPAPADDKAPAKVKAINLDKINTEKDEDDPHLNTAANILLFTAAVKDRAAVMFSVRRPPTKAWGAGAELPDLKGKADCRSVFVTPEGRFPQYLFYATNRDPEKGDERGDNYDIYYLIKQHERADFTSATPVHSVCTARDEQHPWLTVDGRHLFFSRKEKDGWHQYVSSRPADGGQFGQPVALDFPAGFHHATVTSNGRIMYLQGPLAGDRWGLFRSTLVEGRWSKPEPLDALNDAGGPTGDRSPCLSRDLNGTYLYFASDRQGGKGGLDIWAVATADIKK